MTHHVELEHEDENGAVLILGQVVEDPGDYWTPGYVEAVIDSITGEDGGDVEPCEHTLDAIKAKMLESCGIYL